MKVNFTPPSKVFLKDAEAGKIVEIPPGSKNLYLVVSREDLLCKTMDHEPHYTLFNLREDTLVTKSRLTAVSIYSNVEMTVT